MSRARTVALIVGQLQHGGAERQLLELALRCDRARFEPFVICLSEVTEPIGSRLREEGVRVEVLRRARHRDPGRMIRLAGLLAQGCDLAHSWLIAANAYTWAATRIAGFRPFIASSRTCIPAAGPWSHRIHRRAFHAARAVIANAQAVRTFTCDRYGLDPARVTVIPNGVGLEPFDAVTPEEREAVRGALGARRGECLVGTIARLSPEKNVALLLQAARRMPAEATQIARFVIVGAGPEIDRIRGLAMREGIDGRCVFTGDREDVPALLSAMDLFVLTSNTEGLPNAVMEAMAARRAVIATRVGGTEEVVEEGVTGRLVRPGDAEGLARAMEALILDPETRRRHGDEGRRRIVSRFGADRMVESTMRLYDEVLGGARP